MSKFRRTRVTQKKVFGAQYGTRTAFYQDHYNSAEEYTGTNSVGGNAFTFSVQDGGETKDILTMTQYHPMVYDLSHAFQAKQAIYRSARDSSTSTFQETSTLNPVSVVGGVDIQTSFNFRLKGRDDLNFATDEPSDLMAQRQVRKIYMKRSKIDIDIHGAGSILTQSARTNPLHFMIVQQLANQGGGEALTAGGDLQTYIQGILGGMKTKAQNNFKLLNHKVFNQAATTNHNTCKYQYSWKPVDWNRARYNAADADPDDLVPVGQAAYANENNHRYLVVFFETGELLLPGTNPSTGELLDGTLEQNGFIEMKISKTCKYTPATDVTMDDTDPYGITSMVKSLVQKQMKMTEETQV